MYISFHIDHKLSYCTLIEVVTLSTNALKRMSNTGNESLWESGEVGIGQEESLFSIRQG